jgi:hypothetical protein
MSSLTITLDLYQQPELGIYLVSNRFRDLSWYDGRKYSIPTYDLPWFAGEPSQLLFTNHDEACAKALISSSDEPQLLIMDVPCITDIVKESFICKLNIYQNMYKEDNIKKSCPETFSDISYNNSCYHYESEGGNILRWDTAESMCNKNKGALAIFETRGEWEAVKKILMTMSGGNAWIGGKAIASGSEEFQWGDGTKIETRESKKFGWWEGQPVFNGMANCVLAASNTNKGEFGWVPSVCGRLSSFLCEFNKSLADTLL